MRRQGGARGATGSTVPAAAQHTARARCEGGAGAPCRCPPRSPSTTVLFIYYSRIHSLPWPRPGLAAAARQEAAPRSPGDPGWRKHRFTGVRQVDAQPPPPPTPGARPRLPPRRAKPWRGRGGRAALTLRQRGCAERGGQPPLPARPAPPGRQRGFSCATEFP